MVAGYSLRPMGQDGTSGTYVAFAVWRWFGEGGRFSGTMCAVAWCLAIRACSRGPGQATAPTWAGRLLFIVNCLYLLISETGNYGCT